MDLQERLLAIERRLWSNDAAFYAASLVEDARLVFPETGVITRDTAIDAIRAENAAGRHWADVAFVEPQLLQPLSGVALLSYRVRARWARETTPMEALASSLYVFRDGEWKLAFHQQSPIAVQSAARPGPLRATRTASATFASGASATGASAVGAAAAGALAIGACAVGALAIGRLAVGRLAVSRARLGAIEVDELRVGRVRVGELTMDHRA